VSSFPVLSRYLASSLLSIHLSTGEHQRKISWKSWFKVRRLSWIRKYAWAHTTNRTARSKRSRFITLVHAATKSLEELSFGVLACVDFRQGSKLGVRTKDEVYAGAGPFEFAVARSRPSNMSCSSEVAFHVVSISSRFTKKSLVSVSGFLVKTPCWDCP
jgi:hypothetical protein